jgi:hypothetical protein
VQGDLFVRVQDRIRIGEKRLGIRDTHNGFLCKRRSGRENGD